MLCSCWHAKQLTLAHGVLQVFSGSVLQLEEQDESRDGAAAAAAACAGCVLAAVRSWTPQHSALAPCTTQNIDP